MVRSKRMSRSEWQRRYRQRLKSRVEMIHPPQCAHCGGTKRLELAHLCETELKGRGRGLERRYLDVLKNPQCYARLCRKCHRAFDARRTTPPAGESL